MSHPVITLLSDLGTRDTGVTIAHAVLMQYAPGTAIIDISHGVTQYDLKQAAYLLLCAYRHFPKGAVHVLPVDVFYGDSPRILFAEKDGYFFIAPDNGLLSIAFGEGLVNTYLFAECHKPYVFSEWMHNAGKILQGLQQGSIADYPACNIMKAPWLLQHTPMADGVECNIIYIDRFENVVLNITKDQFEDIVQDRPFRIKVLKTMEITAISGNYTDIPVGIPLCRFNVSGFMEIAINHGSAATYLGLAAYSTGTRYPSIKIFY